MRRFFSILFFVLGGWLLSGELMIAFIDPQMGPGMKLTMLAIMLVFALPFLLLGAWINPGRRWRDLGLTLLITAGLVVFAGVSMVAMMLDPKFMRMMPPMPDIQFSPAIGLINLALVAGIGLWLYRRGRIEQAASTAEQ